MRVAIIGWKDSVNAIYEVANEVYKDIEFVPVVINNTDESKEIVADYGTKVDGIIFTGLGFVKIVANLEKPNIPYVYIFRDGTSIMKSFWTMNEEGLRPKKISIDVVNENLVKDICKDFGMSFDKIYVYPFEMDKKERIYLKEHKYLWDNGKIDLVITSYGWIYNELKKEGIPVVRLCLTNNLIKESIERIIYKINNRTIKKSQIATQIVKIDSKEITNDKYQYEFLKKSSIVQSKLIEYIATIQGIISPMNVDNFRIISTRGAMENESAQKVFINILNDFRKEKIRVYSGVGFGNSAYDADFNSRIALTKADNIGENVYFIVDDEKNIRGPLGKKEDISYKALVMDKEINNISKKTGISTSYVSKISCLLKNNNVEYVDSKMLGELLGITDRSARRILKKLVDTGYGQLVTSTQTNTVGRPMNVFKLNI
ncbi:hypothetical protein [Hathewaya limosa]|uniref:Transcriptional regulator n=1 Tax=Hathewaya limosa TaxID=1536 RepID=A0ABU0JTF3_HATLI|nr:hypothetical protein [Hathewaya limosa]MDQ0480380.1 hypothetical protein [Hathewaya limosa]